MGLLKRWFFKLWHSVVGKLWMTIMLLVAFVLLILGAFLLQYIDIWFQENSHDIKLLFVITAVIGFLLSTLFAFFLSAKIQQPLIQLKNAADHVSKGDYSTRVNITSSDEIGQLANTFNDMTDKLDKMIHELNAEKNQLSSILRSMSDSVITFDVNGTVVVTNPSANYLIHEWTKLEEEWQDEDEMAAELNVSSIPVPLRKLFNQVMKEGREKTEKVHVNSSVWSVVMAPLLSIDTVRGAVAVIRDVTEEHKLDKMRADFVANVSHEIRTPLSMLQGYSEALLDDIVASPEERKELVQVIYDESLRMGRLVNDFLDNARMEAGHTAMNFTELDLALVMKRVHRKFLAYAKEREVILELMIKEEPLLIQAGDVDRLEQVLTNLLDNALRHTSSGKRILLAGQRAEFEQKSWIELTVKDEGQGIPREDVPYIFERFYKADKARTRGISGGTGLGLAIVKNLIDLHHGRIHVESEIGEGTSFQLLLPVEVHK